MDAPSPLPLRKTRPSPRRGRPAFVLPQPNGDNERVRAYLRGRVIAPSVIDGFIRTGLLYEDAEHHNCVFVGQDGAGKAVFAAKRGTYYRGGAAFRGDVAGSDKSVAFRTPCDPVLDAVCVFEAPIDLMSWFTLYGKTNALALCGLYDAPLDTYLRENPHLRRIILCLDADGRGRETSRKLVAKYQNLGYETEEQIPPLGQGLERISPKAKCRIALLSLTEKFPIFPFPKFGWDRGKHVQSVIFPKIPFSRVF